jgi:hypothetical protein
LYPVTIAYRKQAREFRITPDWSPIQSPSVLSRKISWVNCQTICNAMAFLFFGMSPRSKSSMTFF